MQEALLYSNDREQLQDAKTIAIIVRGVSITKKKPQLQLSSTESAEAICAVGAGNRGVIPASKKVRIDAWGGILQFAKNLRASKSYVCGVNDGFEEDMTASAHLAQRDTGSDDYVRGWNVGQIIRGLFIR